MQQFHFCLRIEKWVSGGILEKSYKAVNENHEEWTMPKDLQTPYITLAQTEDMEEILKLQHLAYQSEALLHNDFTIQPLRQTLDEAIAECSKSLVLKAVLNGEIIGSVRAYEKSGTAYIGKLMVHPNCQGKGLGRRLLAAIEQTFANRRYELFTSCKSDRNLHLYETAGYVRFMEETDAAGIAFAYLEKTDEDKVEKKATGVLKNNFLVCANDATTLYEYMRIGAFNEHIMNVVAVENRTLDFHVHEDSDEMFVILDGNMQLEFDDGLVDLSVGDFIVVPKGTRHRPVCTSLVKCLLIEKTGTLTRANTGGTYLP
ncbi:MAG: GNAT family N-acetyltransferase [Cystobacterineae bacterium]|nr:GNAT family N-acetyltransferase [Cystobacterineae bacterium]